MRMFFEKKLLTPFAALVLLIIYVTFSVCTYMLIQELSSTDTVFTTQELYDLAVRDAVFADPDEVYPLVEITRESNMVTWNKTKDKILLLSCHRYPDSYPEGVDITFQWGEVWTFTDREIVQWYNHNKDDIIDWTLRLKQLIGLPPEKVYTHISAFWVDPKNVIRPAYVTDITKQMQITSGDTYSGGDDFSLRYTEWFDNNTLWSYFDSAYPWTRLGYTYDWAGKGSEYGLSEFLVLKDSQSTVEFTKTFESFVLWLKEQITVDQSLSR
ncbi:MAG TPA: hypothetical protein DDZ89_02710 [Clostridiales bacterium]|nr:hypothetical protein [Clostridiales bacterium]